MKTVVTVQNVCDRLTSFCHHGQAQEPVMAMVKGKLVPVVSVWGMNGSVILSLEEEDGESNNRRFFDPTL